MAHNRNSYIDITFFFFFGQFGSQVSSILSSLNRRSGRDGFKSTVSGRRSGSGGTDTGSDGRVVLLAVKVIIGRKNSNIWSNSEKVQCCWLL